MLPLVPSVVKRSFDFDPSRIPVRKPSQSNQITLRVSRSCVLANADSATAVIFFDETGETWN